MAPISSFYTLDYARLNALEPRELPRDHGGVTETRRETLQLLRQAVSEGHCAYVYVLINNPLEGNTPLTVQCLSEYFAANSSCPLPKRLSQMCVN